MCWIVGTITFGLLSRHYAALLPWWLAKNAGDVLYATMAYWLIRLLSPSLSIGRAFGTAVAFCFLIEFSKLHQPTWLLTLRHTRVGALILGVGFHVSNLLCYALGALLGLGTDTGTRQKDYRNKQNGESR